MCWIVASLILVLTAVFSKKVLKWICILIKTFPRDIRWLILNIKMAQYTKECVCENHTVSRTFYNLVKKHPDKVAFYYENEAWTYEMVEEYSNRVANYFKGQGYNKGDTIALLLENCATYPVIWLGLSKIGVVTALINTNLVEEPLIHCIEAAKCTALIFGSFHAKVVEYVADNKKPIKLYQLRDNQDGGLLGCDLKSELRNSSSEHIQFQDMTYNDPILYMYTSGTTGLPKAALVSNIRLMLAVKSYSRIAKMTSSDVMYTPLPLYHSAGGLVCVGQALLTGITVAIRKKFSAKNYFKDCDKYNATIGQYVGEMCRYLLANPGIDAEKHRLRVLLGNGLRPQIWNEFIDRFKIKQVIEFYGATEGIANMSNTDGTIGAVGFIPRYLKWAFPVTTIKCDGTTGEPLRNKKGRCAECDVGEPGLLVAKIKLGNALFNFEGYTDKKASEKRILRNVFHDGDVYFSSGDILAYDELGYFYFKDRSGDTFRWKSENVATAEIEAVISKMIGLDDVAVYGVQVPHNEGRAGMAAIVGTNENLDVGTLGKTLKQCLPKYAVPVFLRIMTTLPITGTFKLKKTDLRDEGFDTANIKDKIYFYHSQYEQYVPLTRDLYVELETGKIRL